MSGRTLLGLRRQEAMSSPEQTTASLADPNVLALMDDAYGIALDSFDKWAIKNPEALLNGLQTAEDEQWYFATSPSNVSLKDRHPEGAVALETLRVRAIWDQQTGFEADNPEDYTIASIIDDAFARARRRVIVDKLTGIAQSGQPVRSELTKVFKGVVKELAQPGTSLLKEAARQAELDTYRSEFIRHTVGSAKKHGIDSPQTKHLHGMYRGVAAEDDNVTRIAISTGVNAMIDVTKKGTSPGHSLDRAVGNLRAAYESGDVKETSTDMMLYNRFVRVVIKDYEKTVGKLNSDPSLSEKKKKDLEDIAGSLYDLSGMLGWPIEEAKDDKGGKRTQASILTTLGRTVVDGIGGRQKAKRAERSEGADLRPNEGRWGGTAVVHRTTAVLGAAAAASTVAAPMSTAAAETHTADQSGVQAAVIHMSHSPEGTITFSVPLASQLPAAATEAPLEGPIMASEAESSVVAAAAPATTVEQSTTNSAPATPEQTTPPPQTTDPAPAPQAGNGTAQATTAETNPNPAPTEQGGQAAQSAQTGMVMPEAQVASHTVAESYTYVGTSTGTADTSAADTNITKTPSEVIAGNIKQGEYFDRTSSYQAFRERMGYGDVAPVLTGPDAFPPEFRQQILSLINSSDQDFNHKFSQLSEGQRTEYEVPTMIIQLALDNKDFIAQYDPSEFYTDTPTSHALQAILKQQIGADVQAQVGQGSLDMVMNLLATSDLQLMSSQDQQHIIKLATDAGLIQGATPDHQPASHNGSQHQGDHQGNGQNKPPKHTHENQGGNGHHPAGHHPEHHAAPHSADVPNLEGLNPGEAEVVKAIFHFTQGAPHLRFSMLMGSKLESNWDPNAHGVGSWGAFQEQDPGDPNGPHPNWSIAGAKNPWVATQDMLPDYRGGVAHVPANMWVDHPMLAAERAADLAERPQYDYLQTQGMDRVTQSYAAVLKVMSNSQHGVGHYHAPNPPHGHGPRHGHSQDHGSHGNGHGHGNEHLSSVEQRSAAVRHRIVEVALQQLRAWPKGATDNGNTNPLIAKYTNGRLGAQWAWCAFFETYVQEHAGLRGMPRIGLVTELFQYMVAPGNKNFYVHKIQDAHDGKGKVQPLPGDTLFYNENGSYHNLLTNGDGNHTGIVLSVHGDVITTIDGNWHDRVSLHRVKMSDPTVMAWASYVGG